LEQSSRGSNPRFRTKDSPTHERSRGTPVYVKEHHLRTIVVLALLSASPPMFASEPTDGTLRAVVAREATRLSRLPELTSQGGSTSGNKPRHPVLIGAAIGAGVGAVVGYFGSSCSDPAPSDVISCGTHYKGGAAVLGAGVGATIGALVALAFKH
jgi:hypothetical protein